MPSGFYTLAGYQRQEPEGLTASMEDYLEMICRCSEKNQPIRIHTLAEKLNVRPSSASKMAGHLKLAGMVEFEPYGIVQLTEQGRKKGAELLQRHQLLYEFFCLLNKNQDQLEQVEKIEHFIHPDTLNNLKLLVKKMEQDPDYHR